MTVTDLPDSNQRDNLETICRAKSLQWRLPPTRVRTATTLASENNKQPFTHLLRLLHRVKYIFYLESIRPIRTAENFEAVEWATGFSNKHGCIVGL